MVSLPSSSSQTREAAPSLLPSADSFSAAPIPEVYHESNSTVMLISNNDEESQLHDDHEFKLIIDSDEVDSGKAFVSQDDTNTDVCQIVLSDTGAISQKSNPEPSQPNQIIMSACEFQFWMQVVLAYLFLLSFRLH
jgi:hypothetical protein